MNLEQNYQFIKNLEVKGPPLGDNSLSGLVGARRPSRACSNMRKQESNDSNQRGQTHATGTRCLAVHSFINPPPPSSCCSSSATSPCLSSLAFFPRLHAIFPEVAMLFDGAFFYFGVNYKTPSQQIHGSV